MSLHVSNNQKIKYSKRTVKVDAKNLPLESTRCYDAELVRVSSLSVKKFIRLLRKRREGRSMQLFQVAQSRKFPDYSSICTIKLVHCCKDISGPLSNTRNIRISRK